MVAHRNEERCVFPHVALDRFRPMRACVSADVAHRSQVWLAGNGDRPIRSRCNRAGKGLLVSGSLPGVGESCSRLRARAWNLFGVCNPVDLGAWRDAYYRRAFEGGPASPPALGNEANPWDLEDGFLKRVPSASSSSAPANREGNQIHPV